MEFDGAASGESPGFAARIFLAMDQMPPETGRLLVAAPDIPDERFVRTVVYLVDHGVDGTTGVILNQLSDVAVTNLLPQWAHLCSTPAAFYIGGPVEPHRGLGIAHLTAAAGQPPQGWEREFGTVEERLAKSHPQVRLVADRMVLVDLDDGVNDLDEVLDELRIFVGTAFWAPGQLEQELAQGDWFVSPAVAADIFSPPEIDVYGEVLRRQTHPLPMYATMPADLEMN